MLINVRIDSVVKGHTCTLEQAITKLAELTTPVQKYRHTRNIMSVHFRDEVPRAYASMHGEIVGYNVSFASMCGGEGNMHHVNLTSLASYKSPTGLLESAYELDQMAIDGKGVWRALLNLRGELAESKECDEYQLIARPSTMKIMGKSCLEVCIELVPPNRAPRPMSMRRSAADEKTADENMHEEFRVAAFTTHKVLIVDDSTTSLKVMKKLVGSLGHDVSTAVNGLEALELLKSCTYDIVLMDINMPLMNGLEASSAFRKIERDRIAADGGHPHQKIVAMSSDIGVSLFYECLNAGFDAFVPKPLTKERFHEVLRFLAQQHNKGFQGLV